MQACDIRLIWRMYTYSGFKWLQNIAVCEQRCLTIVLQSSMSDTQTAIDR